MIEITNEMIAGNISYTNGNYRMDGDYRVNPSTHKVEVMNVSVMKSDEPVGSVNAYMNGELLCNYNGMIQSSVSEVSVEISALIQEIENRYSGISIYGINQNE